MLSRTSSFEMIKGSFFLCLLRAVNKTTNTERKQRMNVETGSLKLNKSANMLHFLLNWKSFKARMGFLVQKE